VFSANQAESAGAEAENPSCSTERFSMYPIGIRKQNSTNRRSGATSRKALRLARACAAASAAFSGRPSAVTRSVVVASAIPDPQS